MLGNADPQAMNRPGEGSKNNDWPVLRAPAIHGLLAAVAELASRESEADPVAIMGTAMAWAGASLGRGRFFRVADTYHHSRIYCCLVGDTSRARKGTSWGPVERIFREGENALKNRSSLPFPCGLPLNVQHGLSSGEGLVAAVRDKRNDDDQEGAQDKRLLVMEGELGGVLRHFQRQGNTLSPTLRSAWDGSDLGTMTKSSRDRATKPSISVVGHITQQELKALLSSSDVWGGTANRFLWLAVRRGKILPFAKPMPDDEVTAIAKELARIVEFAHTRGQASELTMSNSARELWETSYLGWLTTDHPGILGAATCRAEAQALRLAMIYAQLDGADKFIELDHLDAALAFWRYCFDSAAHIFGYAEVDPIAQRIIEALRWGPKTQTDLSTMFSRNVPAAKLKQVLDDLVARRRVKCVQVKTAGAPKAVWSLVNGVKQTN